MCKHYSNIFKEGIENLYLMLGTSSMKYAKMRFQSSLYFPQLLNCCSCRVALVLGVKPEPNLEVVLPTTFALLQLHSFARELCSF